MGQGDRNPCGQNDGHARPDAGHAAKVGRLLDTPAPEEVNRLELGLKHPGTRVWDPRARSHNRYLPAFCLSARWRATIGGLGDGAPANGTPILGRNPRLGVRGMAPSFERPLDR
jgi:hypothetical protein